MASADNEPAIAPAAISAFTFIPTPSRVSDTGETIGMKPAFISEIKISGLTPITSPTWPMLFISPFTKTNLGTTSSNA
ncbi:unannotated protein [freshwater metagenome]|uniref:Unannotated protein n=1 Tax=freshwater metagenome TaxID=449393 RepID=A0A6J7U3W5_9ZZZZ